MSIPLEEHMRHFSDQFMHEMDSRGWVKQLTEIDLELNLHGELEPTEKLGACIAILSVHVSQRADSVYEPRLNKTLLVDYHMDDFSYTTLINLVHLVCDTLDRYWDEAVTTFLR